MVQIACMALLECSGVLEIVDWHGFLQWWYSAAANARSMTRHNEEWLSTFVCHKFYFIIIYFCTTITTPITYAIMGVAGWLPVSLGYAPIVLPIARGCDRWRSH